MKISIFLNGLDINHVYAIFEAVNKQKLYRIATTLVILAVLLSQLGLNFLHTHQGQAEDTISYSSQPENGTTPCSACSLDGMPVLPAERLDLIAPDAASSSFVLPVIADVIVPPSGPSQGRAPPVV